LPKEPKPTRTPTSSSDAGRDFRAGCLFLVGIVIVLWIFLWIAWTLWPR
jgi:hypothetical protein